MKKIEIKKAILWGIVAWIIELIISNLLWMNPLSISLNKQFEGHPAIKSFDFLGGITNWILVTFAFGAFFTLILILLYLKLHSSIPGRGWLKGLNFGLMVAFLKALPEAFNQWMVFNYPLELIILQLVNTIIGILIFCIVLGFLYEKFSIFKTVPVS